jgi:uncharacterized membrane protein
MNRRWTGDFRLWDIVRRAFGEFLTVPTAIIVGFVLLAAGSYTLDRADFEALAPTRRFLQQHVFGSPRATSDLLGTIAGGLITVTSITVSLLLVALQQSSSAMTSQVFDQFLRRRINQVYFGTFVGVALYAVLTLATVTEDFNPLYGGLLAIVFTVASLFLLILLLYTTVNQMRPVEIIEAIHDHTLLARDRQRELIAKTRERPMSRHPVQARVASDGHGYVTRLGVDAIARAADDAPGGAEVVLLVSIGDFVAFGDHLAEIRTRTMEAAAAIAPTVAANIHLEIQRDIALDAGYGIEQIETIAWTSISTSKSNPAPGLLGIRSVRDLLARWSSEPPARTTIRLPPIVYHDDVPARAMDALESLAVVSSESMQHQCFAEVVRALATLFGRLPTAHQQRAADVALRIMAALGEHVLTAELDAALSALADALSAGDRRDVADAVTAARHTLARSVGSLNSRSTRVPRAA